VEHPNILTEEIAGILRNSKLVKHSSFSITNFHLSALHELIKQLEHPSLVISTNDMMASAFELLQPNWGLNSGLIFPQQESSTQTPAGFKSVSSRYRQITTSVIKSLSDKIKFILTTSEAAAEKLFSTEKTLPFIVNDQTDYNSLHNWLKNSTYSREDIVTSPGTFALRGGIIDVFSYISHYPTRINFSDDIPKLFPFDIDTQLTTGPLPSLTLMDSIQNKGGLSLFDLFGDSFIKIYIANESTVFVGSKKVSATYSFSLLPIDFPSFIPIRKNNRDLVFTISKQLTVNGFYNSLGHFVIPEWFLRRGHETPIFERSIPKKENETAIEDLQTGDYLVHRDHGVGIYRGLKSDDSDINKGEYLILEYADNGLIYVSTEKFRLISFYASKNEIGVNPDNLNKRATWNRKKLKARKQAEEAVTQLVNLYAEQSSQSRPPYDIDTETEGVFLRNFNYEDTPDQKISWNDISADLSQPRPMNRLLCGDVGFGKTEVAIRAAFRVAYSGKMVAVLAPTTILANQLYSSFSARLNSFSLNVDIISRFRTPAEIRDTKTRVKKGAIDVIVGTHALLYDDMLYNNIGLLIVDEEHRFGVAQKEKIKSLQQSMDVLYLSATPIPRTLHMALSGIRNISMLFTAPKARLPINTQISYFDLKLITDAINHEINRGGQVFFVHNNTKTIGEMSEQIRSLVPGVSVDFAHGKETSHKLEITMNRFIQGKIQVLVATSIIETGIDIQNANTIIINKAHLFGLSQLYQIRGRVGRANRPAYAFLLIPKHFKLSPDAHKRLKSIEENTSLGSGYNISKSDLEIRGAGTLFGYKQSGGSGGVGFELYSQFINEAMRNKTEQRSDTYISRITNVSIKLFADTTIPCEYISVTNLRLGFYKRLSLSNHINEVNQIEYEILNRFGPMPQSAKDLICTTKIRILCAIVYLEKVNFKEHSIMFEFFPFPNNFALERFFENTHEYFTNAQKKHWFKKIRVNALSLVITPVYLEDITSLVLGFLNKLRDIF